MTPKRTQAVASINRGEPRRIFKGSYYGTFVELDADLRALTGITHEMVVNAAVMPALTCRRLSAGSIPACLSKSRSGLPMATSPPWSA